MRAPGSGGEGRAGLSWPRLVSAGLAVLGAAALIVPEALPELRLWPLVRSGAAVYSLQPGPAGVTGALRTVSASPDGRWVLTVEDVPREAWKGMSDSRARLWDARTRKPVWAISLASRLKRPVDRVVDVALWSPDGRSVVLVDNQRQASMVRVSIGAVTAVAANVDAAGVTGVQAGLWSVDLRSSLRSARLLSWRELRTLRQVFLPVDPEVSTDVDGGVINPAGTLRAHPAALRSEASGRLSVKLDRILPGVQARTDGQLDGPGPGSLSLAFDPSGRWLAAGSVDGGLSLWSVVRRQLVWSEPGNRAFLPVRSVAWNSAGTAFVVVRPGPCGWLRAGCVSVVSLSGAPPRVERQVIWDHAGILRQSAAWVDDAHLLIGDGSRAFVLSVPVP